MILLLLLLAQTNVNHTFQVSWKQVGTVNGWNVAIMDRGTTNIRSIRPSTTNAMMLTKAMFPQNGIYDIRVNAYTLNQTSIWSHPVTVNWTYISAPKNFRIQAVLP